MSWRPRLRRGLQEGHSVLSLGHQPALGMPQVCCINCPVHIRICGASSKMGLFSQRLCCTPCNLFEGHLHVVVCPIAVAPAVKRHCMMVYVQLCMRLLLQKRPQLGYAPLPSPFDSHIQRTVTGGQVCSPGLGSVEHASPLCDGQCAYSCRFNPTISPCPYV